MGIKKRGQSALEIIVRRGALRRFAAFKRKASHLPVKVSWDRRVAAPEEPRPTGTAERRQQLPFTWELADFVLIERPDDEPVEKDE
jgi:hypothetical protein